MGLFRFLQKLNRRRILYGLRITSMFALSLVLALLTTSFAPQMLHETAAEQVETSTPVVVTQPETTTTAPETTTAAVTEAETEAQTTTKYKANTNVVVQMATGDREKDEDTGGEKVPDSALSGGSSGSSGDSIPQGDTNTSNGTADVQASAYTDYVYADVSRVTGLVDLAGTAFYLDSNHKPFSGIVKLNGRNVRFNSYGATASRMGIDVSQWNGSINWNKVKAAGVDYAIIRVGFRGYGTSDPVKPVMQDKNAEQNIRGALAAGIDVGLYFFSQAINVEEALEEAGACINMARKYAITYPIYFDTEFATSSHTGRADTLSSSKRTDLAVAFCEAVENAGYKAGVYASKTFFYDELQFSRLQKYAIWVAHYTSKETDFKYSYGAWQYSDSGKVDGISGNTDLNIGLYDYAAKTDMQSVGSKAVLTDSAGLRAYRQAEQNIARYIAAPNAALYTAAASSIQAVPSAEVRAALQKALDDAPASTTVPTAALAQALTPGSRFRPYSAYAVTK